MMKDKSIDELIEILETSTNERTRRVAAYSLGQIAIKGDERAISALVKLLETTTNEETCWQAAYNLGKIATKGNEKAISELVRILETTKNKDIRDKALNSLGQIARDNTTAIKALIKLLSTSSTFLLDEFYRQLEQTQDKAVALQNAQNWLRTCTADKLRQRANEWDLSRIEWEDRIALDATLELWEDIPFKNPYYWAPFILTGC